MSICHKDIDPNLESFEDKKNTNDYIKLRDLIINLQRSTDIMTNDFKYMDKKLEKIDTRLWGIIMLLLAYPLGLIVGKLCHVF